ncbi:MAG: hypothetical protein J6X06_05840 [Elusimicrobiaceae bacterium]|nr:hypothetical protein [Elusimicrobiaceae bacterium]
MGLLKTYFKYMEDPVEGMHMLMARRSFRQACLGYLTAALSWVLFFNIGDDLSVYAFAFKWILVFAAELTAGYFIAALCGLFLDLRRVKVSSAQLFVMLGSSGFIKTILIAFALISAVFTQAHLGRLFPLALLIVFGLQLGYLVRALERTWKVGVAEALGGWLFGFVPVCALFSLLGIFFIWAIVLLV